MIPKLVFNNQDAQLLLREGIKMFSDPVKSTLGPAGRTVIVESDRFVGGFKATKDGVSVADTLRFSNPVHDLVALMMQEAARKTAETAGDGTTTAVVLTEAIINAYDKIAPSLPVVEVVRGLQNICDDMIEALNEMSAPATPEMIRDIATISTNNDPVLGELVSKVFNEVGVVTVDGSHNGTTYTESVSGLTIDKGYVSRYFINDARKQECVLDNPYILLCDKEIKNLQSIEHILKAILTNNESILIVGRVSDQSLGALAHSVLKYGLKAAVVTPPAFGALSKQKMEDLAFITGGKFYSDETGDNLQMITLSGLGRGKKVTISATSTLIEPTDEAKSRIEERIGELTFMKGQAQGFEVTDIESRIESACGSFGVIHVGAPTDSETRELRDRIDDAVCAVRAAKEEGVLPGGGVALIDAFGFTLEKNHNRCLMDIMLSAVQAPVIQMLVNDGMTYSEAYDGVQSIGSGQGFNVKTRTLCDMPESGIIDPSKVVKSALKNAVSVATTILHTSFVVTNTREIHKP